MNCTATTADNLCDTIKLGYLSKAHIQSFLDAYLGQHDLDAAFAAYLFDLTEGNPLFVTEYVKLLQEIGKLAQTDGAWRLQGSITDKDMPIPTSVEKVIEKRVERLKEELQKTLKYASVNGEQFNTLVLAKLLNWDELELLEKLEALSRVHQLVKEINLAPGQTPRARSISLFIP
jgi:predicted ATPase